MHEPYKLVVINLILSLCIILSIIIWKYVYPKKHINLFLLLILISLLPVVSIFRIGDYQSGDFNIHIYRSMAFYDSISEGISLPSWAGSLNATYGYPLFIFNYPLPYYIISFFHLFGFDFITSMKLFLAISFILSGVFMYLFTIEIFKNKSAAFTSSIFYLFTPYHLIDLHFKITIGELLIFTFMPLCFLFMHKLFYKNSILLIVWTGLSISLLALSHVAIALFASIILFLYILFLSRKDGITTGTYYSVSAIFLASILSLYIWLGPIFLINYTYTSKVLPTLVYFPNILDLLYSPWRAGFLFQGPVGQTTYLIGYTQILILAISLFLLVRKKNLKKYSSSILFWLCISFCILFLILPYSKLIWDNIPLIKAMGSHRLLVLLSFTISVLAGYFAMTLKKQWIIYLLLIITIGYTILNWGQRQVIADISDKNLRNGLVFSTANGEGHYYADSKWVDVSHKWFSDIPRSHLQIVKGSGSIINLTRLSTNHTYIVSAKTSLILIENTLYFPGWVVKTNGKIVNSYPNGKGILTFSVPKGLQYLQVTYQDILAYKITKIVSVCGYSLVFLYTLIYYLTIWLKHRTKNIEKE